MPSACAIINCCDKYGHSESVSFHKFPFKRKEQFEKWLKFAQREPNWRPSKWSSICSRHFRPDDFNCINNRKTLKKCAIPTILAASNNAPQPAVSTQDLPAKQSHVERTAHSDAEPDDISVENEAASSEDETETIHAKTVCRLCANASKNFINFANNFEIFNLLQKCFATLNIRTDDNLPTNICHICQKRLQTFAHFIDQVYVAQSKLQLICRRAENHSNNSKTERLLNIKQEPVVNVKQEIQEIQYGNSNFDELDIDGEGYQDADSESKAFEQKFNFFDFPILNTTDIINNCDIMEIVNLDDPFIDIPDDDAVDEHNLPDITIDNTIERQLKNLLPTENNFMQKFMTSEEHSYASSLGKSICKQENNFEAESFQSNNIEAILHIKASLTEEEHYSECMTVAEVQEIQTAEQTNKIENKAKKQYNKPNIVVLNESIVKSADAFQLHNCIPCHLTFFSIENLQQHERLIHASGHELSTTSDIPMVSVPLDHANQHADQLFWSTASINNSVNVGADLKIEDDSQEFTPTISDVENDEIENQNNLNHVFHGQFNDVRFRQSSAASPTILNIQTLQTESHQQIQNEQEFFQQQSQQFAQTSHVNSQQVVEVHESQQLQQQTQAQQLQVEENKSLLIDKLQNDFYAAQANQQQEDFPFSYNQSLEQLQQQQPQQQQEINQQLQTSFVEQNFDFTNNSLNNESFYEDNIQQQQSNAFMHNANNLHKSTNFEMQNATQNLFMTENHNNNNNNMQHNLLNNNHNNYINNNNCDNNANILSRSRSKEQIMLNRYARIFNKTYAKMRLLDRLSKHYKQLHRNYFKLQNKCKNLENNVANLRITHNKQVHQTIMPKLMDSNFKQIKYKCHMCIASFSSIWQLLQHKQLKKHHVKKPPKHFWARCGNCNRYFTKRLALCNHVRYICPSMSLSCYWHNLSNTRYRQRLKKQQEPLNSKIIDVVANINDNFVRPHIPQPCPHCDKVFSSISGLSQHRITHMEERRHTCEFCSRSFKRRNALVQHIRGYHLKIKPFKCEICNHCYALKSDMRRCRHSNMKLKPKKTDALTKTNIKLETNEIEQPLWHMC